MKLFNIFGKKATNEEFGDIISTLKGNNKYSELVNYIISKGYESDFYLLSTEEQRNLLSIIINTIDKDSNFKMSDIIDLHNNIIITNSDEEKIVFFKMVNAYNSKLFKLVNDLFMYFEKPLTVYYIYDILKKTNIDYKYIYTYIKEARSFHVDDTIFLANINKLIQKIELIPHTDSDSITLIVAHQIKSDMHLAGMYDVDESRLVNLENKITKTDEYVDSLNDKIHSLDKQVGSVELKTITVSETAMKAINDYAHRKTSELENEVNRLSKETEGAIDKLKSDLEVAIGEINKVGETWINLINSAPIPKEKSSKVNGPTIITSGMKDGDVRFTRPSDTPILTPANLEQFKFHQNKDEYYHPAFDELLDHASNMEASILIGPHGCGKTHMVKQLSSVTGLRFFNFGFVAEEYSLIKGYNDANGHYVVPPFYEVFKYGGIAFFDEVDASESKALIELNKIVSGPGEYETYEFANNEIVKPHPNFYMALAANTWGDGLNRVYSTREKLDPGTMDRYEPIEMYYDELLEKNILKEYPDMYNFILSYRRALKKLGIPAVISTRGIQAVKNYLDRNKSLNQIFDKRFIRNLSSDQLNRIVSNMKDCPSNYLDNFEKRIKEKVR